MRLMQFLVQTTCLLVVPASLAHADKVSNPKGPTTWCQCLCADPRPGGSSLPCGNNECTFGEDECVAHCFKTHSSAVGASASESKKRCPSPVPAAFPKCSTQGAPTIENNYVLSAEAGSCADLADEARDEYNGKVQQYKCNGESRTQHWMLRLDRNDKCFEIEVASEAKGRCLGVAAGLGKKVRHRACKNNLSTESWEIAASKTADRYVLRNRFDGGCLTMRGKSGDWLTVEKCDEREGQTWSLNGKK